MCVNVLGNVNFKTQICYFFPHEAHIYLVYCCMFLNMGPGTSQILS